MGARIGRRSCGKQSKEKREGTASHGGGRWRSVANTAEAVDVVAWSSARLGYYRTGEARAAQRSPIAYASTLASTVPGTTAAHMSNQDRPAASIPSQPRAKQLRACLLCSIIQTPADFRKHGCPHCEELMQVRSSYSVLVSVSDALYPCR